MRTILTRAAVLATALLVVLPMAASAEVDDYAAEATTTAVSLSVFEGAVGSPILELVGTDALAASDPVASAAVQAIEVMGEELIPVREADSDGEPVRDPEDEGDDCALPAKVTGLTLSLVCASAEADAGGPGEVSAAASTELLDVDVDGSLVATLLADPLADTLNSLTGQIADGATADAIGMFETACNENLEQFEDGTMVVNDLIAMLPEDSSELTQEMRDILDEVDEDGACTAILDLTIAEVVAPVIETEAVAAALEGQTLIQIEVDGAVSDIAGGDQAVDAAATQALVRLTGPALSVLDDVLRGLLEGIRDGLVAEMERITGQELPQELEITDEVEEVIGEIPIFGIDEPLLEATVSGGAATAALQRSDASTTSGGTEPFVELALAGGVLELFGQDPESGTFRVEGGQTQTFGEETPLASTIEVGALTTDDNAEFEGLPGSTARASATTVDLFNGEEVQGGIELVLAESSAGAYGNTPPVAAPDPDPDPLPNTGGGAAVAAILALGAAAALRRRRD